MSEHNDLLPLRSPEEGGPAFELVRRGYDRDQVENHLGWLEDQLRNTEIARDAAEQAAAAAAAEAEAAREELERGRPQWHELGDRITQILNLAEEQGTEIRLQRTREAEQLLADSRQAAAEADRENAARIRDAEAHAQQLVADAQAEAEQLVSSAQAEADRILVRAQTQAADAERASSRRLADLERQRDAVNAQLTRLHEALAQALTPTVAVDTPPIPERASAPAGAVAEQPDYPEDFSAEYEETEQFAETSAATAPAPRSRSGRRS